MKDWETVLDKEFNKPEYHDGECLVALTGGGKCNCYISEIKSFIRSLLQQARQEEIEKALKMIERIEALSELKKKEGK